MKGVTKLTKFFTIFLSILAIVTGWILGAVSHNSIDIITKVEKKGFFNNFLEISIHNLLISFLIISLGFLLYFAGSLIVFSNFLIFGESLYIACQNFGLFKGIILYIHGIFEIPAIVLSLYISYSFSHSIIMKLKNEDFKIIKYLLKFKNIFITTFVLFCAGAIIESVVLNIYL